MQMIDGSPLDARAAENATAFDPGNARQCCSAEQRQADLSANAVQSRRMRRIV
jgi:hypothetical protein